MSGKEWKPFEGRRQLNRLVHGILQLSVVLLASQHHFATKPWAEGQGLSQTPQALWSPHNLLGLADISLPTQGPRSWGDHQEILQQPHCWNSNLFLQLKKRPIRLNWFCPKWGANLLKQQLGQVRDVIVQWGGAQNCRPAGQEAYTLSGYNQLSVVLNSTPIKTFMLGCRMFLDWKKKPGKT